MNSIQGLNIRFNYYCIYNFMIHGGVKLISVDADDYSRNEYKFWHF
jgi:hypothetical protein